MLFRSVVPCDAESRNEAAFREGITAAYCNAHPRRMLQDARPKQPVLAVEALAFVDRMYAVEKRARAEGWSPEQLGEARRTETRAASREFGVWIDNNASERGFQGHAKLRVNAEFAGSPEGAHRWAVLLGLCTTARRLGVDVLAWLVWAIERRGTWKNRYKLSASELTPEAYVRSQTA